MSKAAPFAHAGREADLLKFIFLFLGKTREQYLDAAIADYAARLSRYVPLEIVVLKERYNRNASDEVIKQTGGELLLDRCGSNSFKVALDLSGRQHDSTELAQLVRNWQDRNLQDVYFLIGGHLGLHSAVIENADAVWSLSRLTFTHEMTRVIVLEQLYRACTINAGQKYHK